MSSDRIQILIELLQQELPDSGSLSRDDIRTLRERIDEIDLGLLELLNERSRSANIIGQIKKQLKLPVYVPKREEDVLDRVRKGNQGPLPDESVRRLFERIIDETRALERQKYQDESDKK
ncbi:MAG: chorismate mutase [Bacteroidetes bacterium]|nr:MAG: chorismate mutase [Bacteroidota bacterium]